MRLVLSLTVMLLCIGQALASTTRLTEADSLISSDKTKTFQFPTTSDTLVGLTSTQTLTNKSIDGGSNTLTSLPIAVQLVTDNFSGSSVVTGTATTFTLSFAPPATTGLIVTLDGLVLTIGSGNDFTISGKVITMNTAPALGQSLKAIYSKF